MNDELDDIKATEGKSPVRHLQQGEHLHMQQENAKPATNGGKK